MNRWAIFSRPLSADFSGKASRNKSNSCEITQLLGEGCEVLRPRPGKRQGFSHQSAREVSHPASAITACFRLSVVQEPS